MLFKYHAACYGTHAAIEAARDVRNNHKVSPEDIESIELHVPSGYLKMCNIHEPRTGLEGKFSLRFTTAMGLLGEDTSSMNNYSVEKCSHPAIIAIRDRIKVVANDDLENDHAVADIRLTKKDGLVIHQKGAVYEPDTDQSRQWSRLSDKINSLAVPVIGAENVELIIDKVSNLESLDDLRSVTELAVLGE